MGNRCGFQDQWDSFVRILSSNSPAAFGGSPRRPLMYYIHEDKPGSAVLKKPPKISLAQTDVCFSLLLCVPRGLAGDSALCQLHSGITVMEKHLSDQGWLPRLVTVAWQHVPSGVSQVTSTHIFLAKPKPMLVPKFNWVRKHSSSRWSEEDDQILVSSPTSVTSISQPKTHPPHLCP